jgi:hypothetical protein
MAKNFKTAPTTPPKQPTSEQIVDFVTRGQKAGAAAVAAGAKEPNARISLEIPADLHARFKAACARSRRKMTEELLRFIERRTVELEK